jgi:hypothetical protein
MITKTDKGGKPSRGTGADQRLADNKPKKPKPAFPGAAPPIKPKKPKK